MSRTRTPTPAADPAGWTPARVAAALLATTCPPPAGLDRLERELQAHREPPGFPWLPRFLRPLARKAVRESRRLFGAAGLRQEWINTAVAGLLKDQREESDRAIAGQHERIHELTRELTRAHDALRQQERRLTLLLEEVRRRGTGPLDADHVRTFTREAEAVATAEYVRFEDRFRGSRSKIFSRLGAHLAVLRAAGAGRPGWSVLDIGCGRGEWLDLVRDEGWHGCGLDASRAMVDVCRRRGLEAVEGDAVAHLRTLPEASLGAVTAFHVVEHVPPAVLTALLDETARVLRPGGVAIFETPNPENLVVGACDFYRDPTHVRPLHPDTLQFLAEQHGLVRVEIVRLHDHRLHDPLDLLPWDHPLAGRLNPVIDLMKRRFFNAPDYAVVGHKADG